MNRHLCCPPSKNGYFTREHLYALCVLMLWGPGLALENNKTIDQQTVTLKGVPDGNSGTSFYMLCQNPNVTEVRSLGAAGEMGTPVLFKVLGQQLICVFAEDGTGTVMFHENQEPF